MPRIALTDRFCATSKPLAGLRTDYFDETVPGLALRVTETGRSWSFNFTSPRDGKRARLTIGAYPATSLASARGRAIEARGQVNLGQDPRLASRSGVAEMTVAALVEAFLADPEKAARRSHAEATRRIRRNVIPVIGTVKIAALRRRDVRTATDPLVRRGKLVEACRVHDDVRGMIRWAVDQEFLEVDPLGRMAKPASVQPSDRVLADDEVATLWSALPTALGRSRSSCEPIIKLCLATAQRVGEVAGMRLAELDLRGAEWRLPPDRTKNGFPHVVPLSGFALELIEAARVEAKGSPFLFPCDGGSLPPVLVARTILRANEAKTADRPLGRFGIASFSAHDLRRTALTNMARLGVAPIVLGHIANHRTTTKAGVTLSHYVRHSYDREKREALELWAARLHAIIGAAPSAAVLTFSARV
jgi:integrase